MVHVVTLSTLFPNALQPNFGVFVESQTLRLAARDGVELRVVNPITIPAFPLNLHKRYRSLRTLPEEEVWKGVRIARPRLASLPGLSGAVNGALLFKSVLPVLRRWRAEGFTFDVLDAEFFYPDGPAAARLAKEFGVALSIKARGADIHYWGKRRWCQGQILRAADAADGLLAVAQSLRRDMAALGMDAAKITVHHTGVDLQKFHPVDRSDAKRKLGISGPLIVSLGALIPRKGHGIVIEAMTHLPDNTLLVVGEGPDYAQLAAQINHHGLTGRVRLVGSVPHAELPNILGAADVMALASRSEGLANAWVEALACGTPIAIPNVDGAMEVVDRPAAGRIVADRTPAAFADAIRDILVNPVAPHEVRATVERFTWETNTRTLHAHLEALAALGPPLRRSRGSLVRDLSVP